MRKRPLNLPHLGRCTACGGCIAKSSLAFAAIVAEERDRVCGRTLRQSLCLSGHSPSRSGLAASEHADVGIECPAWEGRARGAKASKVEARCSRWRRCLHGSFRTHFHVNCLHSWNLPSAGSHWLGCWGQKQFREQREAPSSGGSPLRKHRVLLLYCRTSLSSGGLPAPGI